MAEKKKYVYCDALPANYSTSYFYICDFDVRPGDIVVIPIRSNNIEKAALVLDVKEYTEAHAPYPPDMTKHVLRHFGDNESSELIKQKAKVEAEKAVRFRVQEQIKKLAVKESLLKYGVGKKKIDDSKKKLKALIERIPDKNEYMEDFIDYLSDGFRLSADGKTVIEFRNKKTKGKVNVKIPSGVESIKDNVFLYTQIDKLFLPKELKHIGKYTLINEDGWPKKISAIEVEDGNECFFADSAGFYSIENGRKKLERLFDTSISTYTVPEDVYSFAEGSIAFCSSLREIVLSGGIEEFNEYALLGASGIKEIYIPKTVKKLRLKSISRRGWYVDPRFLNPITYHIDEENEYFFKDEDSIYEVLEDGTYKLLMNLYDGKGKALILEGTSVIGRCAFEGHKNLKEIKIPDSVHEIGDSAFSFCSSLEEVKIPGSVQNIGRCAFFGCSSLKEIKIADGVKEIIESAFNGCRSLEKIKIPNSVQITKYEVLLEEPDGMEYKIFDGKANTRMLVRITQPDSICDEMDEEDHEDDEDDEGYFITLDIKVRSPEVWERFDSIEDPEDDYYCLSLKYGKDEELSAEFWSAEEKQSLEHTFTGGGNGDDFYDKLYETMIAFTDVIGKDGVIVGSTGEYGGDDIYVMSYFGEEYVSGSGDKYVDTVDAYEGEDSVVEWVNWFYSKGRDFSDAEEEQLKRCGISYNGEKFEEFR